MNKLIQYLQKPRCLTLAIAVASALVLSAAYISQYGFGLKPCILCLYQRAPYSLNIVMGILAFVSTFRYPRVTALLIYLAALSFFADAVIAGFHVGVEQHWWKGLSACGGDIVPKNVSIEELRQSLTHQAIVRCDEPAWTLFGISMAGYNFAVALSLAFSVIFLRRKKQRGP